MRSEELAHYVEDEVNRLKHRILGIGREQYENEDDVQLFETMPVEKLFEYAREELDDIVVYACMLRIRLDRAEQAIRTTGVGEDGRPEDVVLDMINAPIEGGEA